MRKNYLLLVFMFMFLIILETNAFAANYFDGRKTTSGGEITSTIATINLGAQPAVAYGEDSTVWIMISSGVYNEYVQVGAIRKKDVYGNVTVSNFFEGNDGGSPYFKLSGLTGTDFQVSESSSVQGKYYFYINGASVGEYYQVSWFGDTIEAAEEVLGNLQSTYIYGSPTSKTTLSNWKYESMDTTWYFLNTSNTANVNSNTTNYMQDLVDFNSLHKMYLWDNRN